MKSILKKITLIFVAVISANIYSSDFTGQMCSDIDFISNIFNNSYAPASWKKERYDWSIDKEIDKVKSVVCYSNKISVREYQNLLKEVFNSTKDYHVGYAFYKTESSTLPFTVKGVKERYFISYIDRQKTNEKNFPFQIGDELVEFNDQKTHDAVLKIKKQVGNNIEDTDLAIAEMLLTSRSSQRLIEVPNGNINIKIREKISNKVTAWDLKWDYKEEKVNDDPKLKTLTNNSNKILESLNLNMSIDPNINLSGHNPHSLGSKDGFLPELGNKVWEADNFNMFKAYIYKNNDKNIGYIRIPTYSVMFADFYIDDFIKIVKHLEENTNALVIDQLNNPGGNIIYLYALASILTNKNLEPPKHIETLNQQEIYNSVRVVEALDNINSDKMAKMMLGERIVGYPVDYDFVKNLKNYLNSKIEAWNKGNIRTSGDYILGIKNIKPNPEATYSKPIAILVNSLDFSGGDFFPAIMQDNKRATIIGTRTAGAGGYIRGVQYPNLYGLAYFSYTASIAERLNKAPIENLGVVPDVKLPFTEDDLQNNYSDYIKSVNSEINEMTK